MTKLIDFRSDTVTRPVPAMRTAMMAAEVGDDVYGDDPSVNHLQERIAEMAGHESALLVASGTQSNLVALLTHCGRGDEYIVGQQYHTYLYESGGAASLGGIVPQPLPVEADGRLALNAIEAVIKPRDIHFARTRLLSLENTHLGKVLQQSYLESAITLAKRYQLATHLDGARVFNASVAQGIPVRDITKPFDTVSICCSKGLGAPVGSVLCGSRDFIREAKRWRKMVGGGMRQAGLLAAGIEYALDHHVERLAQDHEHALVLERGLRELSLLKVEPAQTNMLYIELETAELGQEFGAYLREHGVLISSGKRIRLVTHIDIDAKDIARMLELSRRFTFKAS
ncbi:MAG: low-specificity L-threonine aldolase [Burkholderiaceae bacterium]|nr:MAG: low-specificity L-threonine aldolase [Burkholderiaceae bacterium]